MPPVLLGGIVVSKHPANFDYQRYLASREWGLLREQIRERSGNTCEHCFHGPQQAVHHLTYARLSQEELKDLMAVCNDCHEWFSGKSGLNPNLRWAVVTPPLLLPLIGQQRHFLLPFSADFEAEPVRRVDCFGAGCIWCKEEDENWTLFLRDLILVTRAST